MKNVAKDDVVEAVTRLMNAAEPFTSGNTVDETSGTIPLMKELKAAIAALVDMGWARVDGEVDDISSDDELPVDESLQDFRARILSRCSPDVTPQEYMKALDDREYIHPDSEAATPKQPIADMGWKMEGEVGVPIPRDVDTARLMALMGINYLEQHAPHLLNVRGNVPSTGQVKRDGVEGGE